jgi:hypothetical protein
MGILCLLLFDYLRIKNFLVDIPENISRLWREDRVAIFGIMLVLLLLLLRYAAWVTVPFNFGFDDRAELVFPQKMLQSGALGEDPFSERRIYTLGGHSFLHVFVFSFLQIQNLHIIDRGLAYIIAVGILWGFAREKKVSQKLLLLTASIFLLLINPIKGNCTSFGMGLVLFLALFRVFDRGETLQWNQRFVYVFIGALLVSALCASKTVFIVFCAIYLGLTYGMRFFCYRTKKDIALEFLILLFFAFLLLLPWMVSLYQSSGTMFYPLLGKGYHRSAYGYVDFSPLTLRGSLATIYSQVYRSSALFLMTLCLLSLRNPRRKNILQPICICISAVIGLIVMNLFFRGRDVFQRDARYVSPFFFACLACAVLYVFSNGSLLGKKELKRISYILVVLFIPLLLMDPLGRFVAPNLSRVFPAYCQNIYVGIRQGKETVWSYKKQMGAYRKTQYAVPAGEIILTRVNCPFLLDFKRNKIFIVDLLILGPPAGMPVFRGGDAVAAYLVSQGIRYVLYDYGEPIMRSYGHFQRSRDRWTRQSFLFTLRLQDDLDELGATRKRLYDDGKVFVIDLYEKALDRDSDGGSRG